MNTTLSRYDIATVALSLIDLKIEGEILRGMNKGEKVDVRWINDFTNKMVERFSVCAVDSISLFLFLRARCEGVCFLLEEKEGFLPASKVTLPIAIALKEEEVDHNYIAYEVFAEMVYYIVLDEFDEGGYHDIHELAEDYWNALNEEGFFEEVLPPEKTKYFLIQFIESQWQRVLSEEHSSYLRH